MCLSLEESHEKGHLTPHDIVVGTELARVVTGGDVDARDGVSEDDLFAAERTAFVKLARTGPTLERIAYMLDQGGALRN